MTRGRDAHADVYDAIAAEFAAINAEMPPGPAALAEALLAQLPPAPEVLDAGCGHGRDMAWLEARGARVTGLDVSPGMLEQARPRVRGWLVEGDLRELPFGDASFDGVWCNASLLHLPKRDAPAAARELRRVLRDRGRLALTLKLGRGERWHEHDRWPARYFALYEADELTDLLTLTGFGVDAVSESGHGWISTIAQREG